MSQNQHLKKDHVSHEVKYTPVRLSTVTKEGVFEGYASLFNTTDLGQDVVRRGAFLKSLRRTPAHQVKLLYQHNPHEPIGIWHSIKEDHKGLYVKGEILREIPRARDVHSLMKHGALDGLSIGFKTKKAAPIRGGKGRQLVEVDLFEISVVTFPMHPGARITTVKAKAGTAGAGGVNGFATIRDFERWLTRDAGFTRKQAKIAIANGFKTLLHQREAEGAHPAKRDNAHQWRHLTKLLTTPHH